MNSDIDVEYPLGAIMHDDNPRTRIAETLLTTKRALPVREISREAQCPPAVVDETLRAFERVGLVRQTTFGVYHWRRGSSVGLPMTELRELLHARLHPESWSAEMVEGSA